MRSLKSFLAVCFIMLAAGGYAANETPMQLLKKMREAAVNNDTATILSLSDGELLEAVKNAGALPPDLRADLLFINAAFEDIHVRLATPSKAEIHGFIKSANQVIYLNVQMQHDQNAKMKITSIKKMQYLPHPFLDKFLAACRTNTLAQYRDLITKDLAKKYANIPDGFKTSAEMRITPGKASANSAVFTIDRNGIKGNIQMIKDNYYWKISAFDTILAATFPTQVVEQLCEAAKTTKSPNDLQNFLSGKASEKFQQDDIALFSGFTSIISQKLLSKNKFSIEIKTVSEAETGIIKIELEFQNTSWLICDYDKSLIYDKEFSPTAVSKKFLEIVIKKGEFESEAAKSLASEEVLSQLKSFITSPQSELTFTIEEEDIIQRNAKVTVAIQKSNVVAKANLSMTLELGKWIITNATLTPPSASAEQSPQQDPEEE